MPRGTRAPFRGQPTRRRKRVWARETHQFTGAQSDAQEMLSEFAAEYGLASGRAPVGSTIGGLKFELEFRIRTVAGGAATQIGYGFIVATGVATEIPRPFTDRHADWLWWGAIPATDAAVGGSFGVADANHLPVTVRSMRKLEEVGQRFWFCTETLNHGGGTLDVNMACSTLLILP